MFPVVVGVVAAAAPWRCDKNVDFVGNYQYGNALLAAILVVVVAVVQR